MAAPQPKPENVLFGDWGHSSLITGKKMNYQ